MNPQEVRERLGLAEDASDEEVQTAIAELATGAGLTTPVVPGANSTQGRAGVTPVATGGVEPEDPQKPPQPTPEESKLTTGQQAATASAGQQGQPVQLPAGMVAIDADTLATLQAGAQAGIEVKTKSEQERNKREVAAAVADGRIPPAAAEKWEGNLKTDYESFAPVLASMPKGLIPVEMRGNNGEVIEMIGHSGGAETTLAAGAEQVQGWTDSLFPEVRANREAEARVREQGPRAYPRIQRDSIEEAVV